MLRNPIVKRSLILLVFGLVFGALLAEIPFMFLPGMDTPAAASKSSCDPVRHSPACGVGTATSVHSAKHELCCGRYLGGQERRFGGTPTGTVMDSSRFLGQYGAQYESEICLSMFLRSHQDLWFGCQRTAYMGHTLVGHIYRRCSDGNAFCSL